MNYGQETATPSQIMMDQARRADAMNVKCYKPSAKISGPSPSIMSLIEKLSTLVGTAGDVSMRAARLANAISDGIETNNSKAAVRPQPQTVINALAEIVDDLELHIGVTNDALSRISNGIGE